MTIEQHSLKVSTTGSSASATGSGSLALARCKLLAVYVDYHASAPASTAVTISAPGNPAARTILTITNNATDAWYFPKEQDMGNTGSAITGSYSHPLIHNNLLLEIAGADALTDCVDATIFIEV